MAGLVLLEAVGVGIAGGVEPVPSPALAVVRAGQEPVDQLLVGVGASVGEEGVDLLGRRREADEVEAQAADEGGPVGLGRGLQLLALRAGRG